MMTEVEASVLLGIVYHSDSLALRKCLDSANRSNRVDLQIIVLDVSPDASGKGEAFASGATWCDGSRNAGYAWGLAEIFRQHADNSRVFVASNSDVVFAEDSVSNLARHALGLNAVSYPLQRLSSGEPAVFSIHHQLSLADATSRWLGIQRRKRLARVTEVIDQAQRTKSVVRLPAKMCGSGAVIAVPRTIWTATGGLDVNYFLFEEDRSFGAKLTKSHIHAVLCGDSSVIHDGGFKTKGVRAGSTLEALVSERIAWRDLAVAPMAVLVALQVLGLTGRILVFVAIGQRRRAAAYLHAMRLYFRIMTKAEERLFAADGYRVPATTAAGVRL